jgi:CRP-like cAMP-binding protein
LSESWWPELRDGDLVRHLTEEEYRRLLAAMKTWTAPQGAVILAKGDPSEKLILVTEGEVEVVDGEVVLARIGPGGVVGEVGFIDGHPRTHNVRACMPCRLWSLERKTLLDLLQEDACLFAKLTIAVAELLAIRFRSVVQDLDTIRSFTAAVAEPSAEVAAFDEIQEPLPESALARPGGALEAIRDVARKSQKDGAGV